MQTVVLFLLVIVAYYVARMLRKRGLQQLKYAWGVALAGFGVAAYMAASNIIGGLLSGSVILGGVSVVVGLLFVWPGVRNYLFLRDSNFWNLARLWIRKKRDEYLNRRS